MEVKEQCCVCHKTKTDGQWVDDVYDREASHGYCPECFEVAMEKVKNMEVHQKKC